MRYFFLLLIPVSLMAQNPPSSFGPPSSTMTPSSRPPTTQQQGQQAQQAPEVKRHEFKPAPLHVAPIVQNPRALLPDQERTEIYTEPGIIGMRDGKWVGSDNLFNLSSELGVAIDIIAPEGKSIAFTKEDISASLMKVFEGSAITAHTTFSSKEAATPFFNVLLMVYPVPQGYVAFVSCRLFEEATLKRTDLAPGITWQVITWERETLIVSSSDDFKEAIQKTVNQLGAEFVERFKHFESLGN